MTGRRTAEKVDPGPPAATAPVAGPRHSRPEPERPERRSLVGPAVGAVALIGVALLAVVMITRLGTGGAAGSAPAGTGEQSVSAVPAARPSVPPPPSASAPPAQPVQAPPGTPAAAGVQSIADVVLLHNLVTTFGSPSQLPSEVVAEQKKDVLARLTSTAADAAELPSSQGQPLASALRSYSAFVGGLSADRALSREQVAALRKLDSAWRSAVTGLPGSDRYRLAQSIPDLLLPAGSS